MCATVLCDVVLKGANSIDRNPYHVAISQGEVVAGNDSGTGQEKHPALVNGTFTRS